MNRESSNPTVTGASCNYTTLSHYNVGAMAMQSPTNVTTTGKYVVPQFSAPTYDTLMHGAVPSCSGYFNINSAYKTSSDGNCAQQYVTKLCQ